MIYNANKHHDLELAAAIEHSLDNSNIIWVDGLRTHWWEDAQCEVRFDHEKFEDMQIDVNQMRIDASWSTVKSSNWSTIKNPGVQ